MELKQRHKKVLDEMRKRYEESSYVDLQWPRNWSPKSVQELIDAGIIKVNEVSTMYDDCGHLWISEFPGKPNI